MPESPNSIDGCDGISITVKIVPGSSRTESAGLQGQAYKIKIAAPPEKGRANKMLVAFLAEELNIKKTAIEIKHGKTSPLKQIVLRGVTKQDVQSHFG
ncbi:MAG: DUF167 domain-containing protein [Planctomycetota bacterium]|jgi:uncharacterized protein (TIGR00251 family)